MYRNTYVEVNLNNLKYNIKKIRDTYNNYDYYFGVVKGNAYGHSNLVAKYLVEAGINYLVVSSLDEALEIRKDNPSTPILCCEVIDVKYLDKCIDNNITITITDLDYANELLSCNIYSTLKVHLKIDSGMSRLGISTKDELKQVVDLFASNDSIYIEGIYSHFATVGIYDNYWDRQVDKFKEITSSINLCDIPIVHMGNSISLVNHPKIPFCNGIRLGLIMYGYIKDSHDSSDIKSSLRKIKRSRYAKKYNLSPVITDISLGLKEAFSLYSEVIQVKKISVGDTVSYGAKYVAKKDTNVAVISIGYADGIRKSCVGYKVVIRGKKYPIIGDVCMGMIIVEVDDDVKRHDIATIIGSDNSIFCMSRYLGTSVYEVLCNISPLIPRKLIIDENVVEIDER